MTFKQQHALLLASSGVLTIGIAFSAFGADARVTPSSSETATQQAVENYWTPERMKAARPIDLRPASVPRTGGGVPQATGTPLFHRGAAPQPGSGGAALADPGVQMAAKPNAPAIAPPNVGNGGAYFTTSRVFPSTAPKSYPNSAAGILYFTDPATGGNYICSASAISHRLVVTAGHCTAHASTTSPYFYTNWLFVPASTNGAAPFGKWKVTTAYTTSNWYYSDGSVPNVQDIGMLVMKDQKHKGAVAAIGNVTGWLGWWTLWGRYYPNNVTQLGYPCNLDSCALMEYNAAQGFNTWNNTVEIGSAMQGGSSGGPWIQDYGQYPAGGPTYTAGNWVIGVTSWGFTDQTQMIQGASIFENAGYSGGGFGDLWNAACAQASGNC